MSFNFDRRKGQVSTTFFDGARTNICYNAVDRHIEHGRGSQPCFLWEVSAMNGLCTAHRSCSSQSRVLQRHALKSGSQLCNTQIGAALQGLHNDAANAGQ